MATAFCTSLPTGFHAKLSSPVNTMEHLKQGVKIGDKVVFDLKSIFLHLLVVGQQREVELLPIFGDEVCAVPPLLTDEYGCVRRRNKAILVHELGVKHHKPPRPDVIIVDAQQLLHHMVWPCAEMWVCGGVTERMAYIVCCYRKNPRFLPLLRNIGEGPCEAAASCCWLHYIQPGPQQPSAKS